ncbi:hypothetical protein AB4027_11535 [Alkalibacterium putridalgicola]|uniref:hypothetical protein n=1 Tax=Alkalibacterium putridalgicola TaxID=426703 RepID=UPI0034CE6C87
MSTDEKRTEMKQQLREQFLKKPTYRHLGNRYIETRDPHLLKKINQDYSNL